MKFQSSIAIPSRHPLRQRLTVAAVPAFLLSLAAAGCGSASGGSAPATSAPAQSATSTAAVTSPTPTPASGTATLSCPTAAEVDAALGLSVPTPTTIGTSASGVSCNYLSTSAPVLDVEISIVHDIPTTYVSTAEASMKASAATVGFAFTPVSGVGDQAYSYSYSLSPSGTALGILAVKGTNFVGIACTMTTATLTQVEAYANQLLG